ncbi:cytochrome c oxidase assembly protein COX18, mitochondrial isoform X2 [Tiliqua scincoides]|uniref:cytochrome c oxidase assembly protein COX18, mitochondrial isoform X2 n=1 Tax=Tiliqua scincoides TaxID=71010 RepID=UPI003461E816
MHVYSEVSPILVNGVYCQVSVDGTSQDPALSPAGAPARPRIGGRVSGRAGGVCSGRRHLASAEMAAGGCVGVVAFSWAARGLRRQLRFGGSGTRAFRAPAPGPGALPEGWAWYEALAASAPVACTEWGLAAMQAASGLPWWATVVAASAALRTGLTLPLAAQQGRVLAKLENLQPEIQSLAKHLRYEVSICAKQRGWSEKLSRYYFRKNLKRIVSELYVRDNCHPFKASLLIWIQIPAWVFVSIALRNFSVGRAASGGVSIEEQLSTGGTLWFMDLTAPDTTWILPITLGLLNLLIVEIFALKKTELSRIQKYATNFFRGVSLLMIPIAATVPSGHILLHPLVLFLGENENCL